MLVIVHIVVLLAACYYAGFSSLGLYAFLLKDEDSIPGIRLIAPIIGQAILQLLFWYSYRILQNSRDALELSFALLVILNLLQLILIWRNHKYRKSLSLILPRSEDLGILLVCVIILLFSSWPYLILGEGHYFLSGNQDIFEIISGSAQYLDNVALSSMSSWISGAMGLLYSSNAFWSLLFKVSHMDAFVLSATANLLLGAISVYWFAHFVIASGRRTALWLALASVLANFFFSAYLAGHRGSVIYSSTAPVLLGGLLLMFRSRAGIAWVIPLALLYHFLDRTYPGPFYFLLIPALFTIIVERLLGSEVASRLISGFKAIRGHARESIFRGTSGRVAIAGAIIAILLFILASWVLWRYMQAVRFSALMRTSTPWGIAFSMVIWPIFWGVFPSNVFGSSTPLFVLMTHSTTSISGWILTFFFVSLTLWAAWVSRSSPSRRFLFVYICSFVFFGIFMRFFFASSYYFYKFLYVNYFLIVCTVGLYITEKILRLSWWKRTLLIVPVILMITVNVFWDLEATLDIYERPYHQKQKIEGLVQFLKKECIQDFKLAVPNAITHWCLNYALSQQDGLHSKHLSRNLTDFYDPSSAISAPYEVTVSNIRDVGVNSLVISPILYDNGLFRVVGRNQQNRMIIQFTFYGMEPDLTRTGTLHWTSNILSETSRQLREYVEEALEYILRSGKVDKTFVDLFDPTTRFLIQKVSSEKRMTLQPNPRESRWFLRFNIRDTELKYVGLFTNPKVIDQYSAVFYERNSGEKIAWQNSIFALVEIPGNERIVSSPRGVDIPFLVDEIKKRGQSVFLDMPVYSQLKMYLEQQMPQAGTKPATQGKPDLLLVLKSSSSIQNGSYDDALNHGVRSIWRSKCQDLTCGDCTVELKTVSANKDSEDRQIGLFDTASHGGADFTINLSNLKNGALFLRILLAPGPSIDSSPFNLSVSSPESEVVREWKIVPPMTLVDVDIREFLPSYRSDLTLRCQAKNLIGHSLLPYVERVLNYSIRLIELTDRIDSYSPALISSLNTQLVVSYGSLVNGILNDQLSRDIVSQQDTNGVWIGTGWYPSEVEKGQVFRWANADAQLIFRNVNKRFRNARLQLEPGPACGKAPLPMSVWYKDRLLCTFIVRGKQTVNVPLPIQGPQPSERDEVLTIKAETPQERIPSDSRILGFRVFRVTLNE